VFENRVLKKIFGHKKDEVIGSREGYITKGFMINFRAQYYLCDQLEKNEMDGHVVHTGERSGVYRVLVGKTDGKKHL
jgi:hypothetical protein